jgi:hypothetical protein
MSTTFLTLYQYAQRRLHNKSGSNAVAIAKECTNRAMRRIAERNHPHFRTQGYIPLIAAYSSGTVAIANGGTVVSGTNATWSSAMTGRYMKIDDEQVHFQLTSYSSQAAGPSFTFDAGAKWLGDTVTSGSYVIYADTYDLPSNYRTMGMFIEKSILTDVDWLNSEDDWYKTKMLNNSMTGAPRWACMENSKLRLWPYETTLSNLSFIYYRWPTEMSADGDLMDFPDQQIDLVRAAIRLEVAIERDKDVDEHRQSYMEKEQSLESSASHPHASFSIGSGDPEVVSLQYTIGEDET